LIVQKFFGFNLMVKAYGWSFKEMIPLNTLYLFFGLASLLGLVCFLIKSYFSSDQVWFAFCSIHFAVIYLGTLFVIRKDLFGNISFLSKFSYFFNRKKYSSLQKTNNEIARINVYESDN
ncbi:MAG: hypothetical protein H7336_17035, partial [Bacteriovorax sp.]|nr:hypothetical protein [Bacteriovorax sp.]